MYLGYQDNKIKLYVEEPLSSKFYPIDEWVETQDEYVIEGDEYVIKDSAWEEREAQRERERLDKLSLTKREVFLALYEDKDITPEQLRSQIEDTEALIEFDYADRYFRGNPLINQLGQLLGYTSEELDYLFEFKELPKE